MTRKVNSYSLIITMFANELTYLKHCNSEIQKNSSFVACSCYSVHSL